MTTMITEEKKSSFFTERFLINKDNIKNEKKSRNLLRWQMVLLICLFLPVAFLFASMIAIVPVMIVTPDLNLTGQLDSNDILEKIDVGLLLLSTIISELILVGGYILFAKRNINISIKELLGFQNFNSKAFAYSGLIGIALFFLLQLSATIVGMFSNDPVESSDTSTSIYNSSGIMGIITLFLIVPLLAPIVEEILFRGVILNGLSLGGVKNITAILISSFIFGIAHFQGMSTVTDVFILVWISFMAFIQAIVFIKTKSIYNTMAIHVAYNSITAIAPFFF